MQPLPGSINLNTTVNSNNTVISNNSAIEIQRKRRSSRNVLKKKKVEEVTIKPLYSTILKTAPSSPKSRGGVRLGLFRT